MKRKRKIKGTLCLHLSYAFCCGGLPKSNGTQGSSKTTLQATSETAAETQNLSLAVTIVPEQTFVELYEKTWRR
jgi:hypothetical protein